MAFVSKAMRVSYDFSGKTTVVTGGSKGIGRAICCQLKQSGAQVWNWDLSVVAFTKALGKELDNTAIRVNVVAPAAVDTDLIRQFSPDAVNAMIARTPLNRLGTVEEVARLVAWLCSDDCSFSTGAVFDLSGGQATY
jgi:NAD(P)-dependent dehydrogenase (short-subunit alcohol dehydrogenase family)